MLIVTPRLIPDDKGFAIRLEDYFKLEAELAALKAELREICAAIDDSVCDLTLTAVECIKKLKEENESLRFEVIQIRKSLINWRQRAWPGTDQTKVVDRDFPAIAAMAQGEK